MSKLARTLVFAASLAAMNLAGMTAVAQAQANDQPARRPPTQGQVGESWHQRQVTAEQPNIASDARRPPTESQVGESWRHQTDGPAQPVEPGGLPSWIMASLGLLAAGLVVAGGLAVLAARRAGRRARVGARGLTMVTSPPHSMGLPHPPGSPITHPSARHQPLQTDPEATETTQPDHTPAAASTSMGSSSASGRSAPPAPPGSAAVP